MASVEDAQKCIDSLNGQDLQGRRIRVDFSTTQKPHNPTPGAYMGPRRPACKPLQGPRKCLELIRHVSDQTMIDHPSTTVDDTDLVMIEVVVVDTRTTDTTTDVLPSETTTITMVDGKCFGHFASPFVPLDICDITLHVVSSLLQKAGS